jgi:hypothetical protein
VASVSRRGGGTFANTGTDQARALHELLRQFDLTTGQVDYLCWACRRRADRARATNPR